VVEEVESLLVTSSTWRAAVGVRRFLEEEGEQRLVSSSVCCAFV